MITNKQIANDNITELIRRLVSCSECIESDFQEMLEEEESMFSTTIESYLDLIIHHAEKLKYMVQNYDDID